MITPSIKPLPPEIIVKKVSILRWSGSKAKLVPHLAMHAPKSYTGYVEPFAGSACLYFALEPERAVLGDINPEVVNVYRAIASDPDLVSAVLESIPKTPEAYYQLRSVEPERLEPAYRAARLIFLMKACFNGVYRTNRDGRFNVPMGTRVYALPDRDQLRRAQQVIKNTELVSGDFCETLALSRPGDWVYLDPPYRKPGRYRGEYGYLGEFGESKILELIEQARNLARAGRHVMISYIYDESLIAHLPGWKIQTVSASRTVASKTAARQTVPELILTSY